MSEFLSYCTSYTWGYFIVGTNHEEHVAEEEEHVPLVQVPLRSQEEDIADEEEEALETLLNLKTSRKHKKL